MTINLFLEYLLMPVIVFAGGLLMCMELPLNGVAGYKTKRSMSSPELWAYAQKLAGRLWLILGAILLTASLIMILVTPYRPSEAVYGTFFIAILIGTFVFVERKLKVKEKELKQE
ncbi:MAG: SdpI family protein [Peptococcaceae bacterium]|nr:SdpI family protein [Peptococcaceae bacterium]MBO5141186.1 SdpI family protein [Peptococcaceae bacterium]MBO5301041.1 SdpI family protein [Peptococcaceae bacterium]MBO5366106.1 SdpI family protein [Peptococcaceae bacterium]MBO5428981.1 SdpI family protein [Peptococcaceae bacterium]